MNDSVIYIRNDQMCKLIGTGTIKLKLGDGTVKTLEDVRHVLELKRNLISLSVLAKEGYVFKGHGEELKVTR